MYTSELCHSRRETGASSGGYRADDIAILSSFGIAAGVGAILVFCLYIAGETAVGSYRSPEYLWIAVPALLYWIGRVWMLSSRGELRDDPIVFAASDRNSWLVAIWVGIAFVLAMFVPGLPL